MVGSKNNQGEARRGPQPGPWHSVQWDMNTKIILLAAAVAVGFAPAARAQHIDVDVDIRLGRAAPPPPPEVIVVDDAGPPGPPPWARSHWYRRSYGYYYYPGYDVYYRPADRVWFYLDGGSWRFGARLPDHIHVDFRRSVTLKLESDRPYTYHQRVVTYYPPTYFSRVKFKHENDNRRDDRRDNDRRDRDDRGRHDRGKGNDRDKHK